MKKVAIVIVNAYLAIITRCPFRCFRAFALRVAGANIEKSVNLYLGVTIISPWRLRIEENTIVGKGVYLDSRGGLHIGRNCNISNEAAIWTAEHDIQDPGFKMILAPVTIGDRAWICFRSVIMPGVTVGEGSVVASGAVVTNDVPPFSVVAGIPAKVIGRRERELFYELHS